MTVFGEQPLSLAMALQQPLVFEILDHPPFLPAGDAVPSCVPLEPRYNPGCLHSDCHPWRNWRGNHILPRRKNYYGFFCSSIQLHCAINLCFSNKHKFGMTYGSVAKHSDAEPIAARILRVKPLSLSCQPFPWLCCGITAERADAKRCMFF